MTVRSIALYAGVLCAALASGTPWAARAESMVELAQKPAVAPAPDWVTPVAPEPFEPQSSQLNYLLIDRQLRVEDRGSSSYAHFVVHLGNQSAVDDESHLQIIYRPATERITLHHLTLRRGNQVIDLLPRARISTLRRELDLEKGIIDGDLTTSIVLEDVRVGDVLDYSFTRSVGEDGLGTAFSDAFTTQWSIPVKRSYLRVLHPARRNIAFKSSNASEQPHVRTLGAWRELAWEWRDLSSLPPEEDRPGWYVHYPFIQVSEAQSWQEVARWAQRLYPRVPLTAELRSLIAQLRTQGDTKEEWIVQALRFVQDEIRYTGIEIGPGAYRPQPPAVVLERRYGDCKEKSYLLMTLLDALGVDARPALVSTYRGHASRDMLPSAGVFNHMIVRVEHAGKVYWLDPTRTLQGGTLDSIQQAHFGAALVVEDAGRFETMPPAAADLPNEIIVERFDLKAGVLEKADMEVKTTYLGPRADRMRNYFAAHDRDEVTREYLNFYEDLFPGISVSAPFNVDDDRRANRIVVTEKYALEPAFTKDEKSEKHYFELYAHVVRSAARAPKTILRTAPLQLDHPTHVRYRAEVHLPEPWGVKPFDENITTPGFTYTSSVRYRQDTVVAEYVFKTLADSVPAADVPEHARKLEAVRDDAYYYLSYDAAAAAPRPFKLSMAMLMAIVGGVVGGGLSIRWLHRYDNPRFPRPASANAPVGLRGWLLLPAIGTVVSPFAIAYVLYLWRGYFDAAAWAGIGAGQDPVLAHWGKIGLFVSMLAGHALLLATVFLIYLMFTKRRSFPAGYIALSWIGAVWGGLITASVAALGLAESYLDPGVVRDFLSAALWTAYMLSSERVRATFVRTRSAPEPITQPEASVPQPVT